MEDHIRMASRAPFDGLSKPVRLRGHHPRGSFPAKLRSSRRLLGCPSSLSPHPARARLPPLEFPCSWSRALSQLLCHRPYLTLPRVRNGGILARNFRAPLPCSSIGFLPFRHSPQTRPALMQGL
jgi:hypothetical protein